ncbi:MAG TPA: alpha-L-arabinofuranosidase C-terminal domain-containing protein [Verrucomicrobiae bacterium]
MPNRSIILPFLLSLPLAGGMINSDAADQPVSATLVIDATAVSAFPIPRELTGKFCEHLGANIYNGMDAQILRNPTFADYPFWTGQMSPDGITTFHFERPSIEGELRRQAIRAGWPEAELPGLLKARNDSLACFWARAGRDDDVQISPDTGPQGGRAQRLELRPGAGVRQWAWLPLHRTRQYEIQILARSPDMASLRVTLSAAQDQAPTAEVNVSGLGPGWRKLTGSILVPRDAAADAPYCLTLSAETGGQLVLGHVFLRPADHVNGADPDVIRLLKESRLPLLRWPGGNFVSAYHWEDGVGPVESRPTKPNYAWGGVEPNTFGTDEFIAFCRAVGCEPMICVNAGTGTPAEAARWIEYCNGPATSPMGGRRAANGHPEPYRVRRWEVGNELWGHWQAHWTTASGYVDRYRQFSRAMLESAPDIQLLACGAPVLWGKNWNDTLIAGLAGDIRSFTDHPLIGGDTPRATDPLDVFRDFMRVPDILERKWGDLREDASRGGAKDVRLAVTELQMFAHLGAAAGAGEKERLNRENLVNPATLGEALYDTLIYHAAARLQPFVSLVTHSATVNHGGGLRKERERVYANPCHYAHLLLAEFAGAKAVKSTLQGPSERAPLVLPEIRNAGGDQSFGVVDALVALSPKDELLLSAVNRGTAGPINLTVKLGSFRAAGSAEVFALSGPVPWAVNTLAEPDAIRPVRSPAEVREGEMVLALPPFSVVRARLPAR